MLTGRTLPRHSRSGNVPAVDLLGPDGRADAHAVVETFSKAHAVADARTDARTDDGDARAHASTVREPDARALVTTDDSRAVRKTDAVALFV